MRVVCHIRDARVLADVRAAFGPLVVGVNVGSLAALHRVIRRQRCDVAIIDLPVAPRDDDAFFAWLRQRGDAAVPLIILTPHRHPALVAGLLLRGADDVLVRPFAPVELAARSHALLRRAGRLASPAILAYGGVTLDRAHASCTCQDQAIGLTAHELRMAWMLFAAPGTVISHARLGAAVTGSDGASARRLVEQHIGNLRRKMRTGGCHAVTIRAVDGQGYRLDDQTIS